jgi:hypothetical protein
LVAKLAEAFLDNFKKLVSYVAFTASTDTLHGVSEAATLLKSKSINFDTDSGTGQKVHTVLKRVYIIILIIY